MKERVETLISSFKDYKGMEHKMVLAAVSKELPKTYGEACPNDTGATPEEKATLVYHEVQQCTEWDCDWQNTVVKSLHLGIAICNPEDKFSERAGIAKATHRARNSKAVMYVTKNGYINATMVKAFLQQEAEHIKNNPGQFIEGYDEAEDKYNAAVERKKTYEALSDEDKQLVGILATVDAEKLEKLKSLVKEHEAVQ